MKICPKCGNALADDAQFCTLCGAKMAAPQQESAQNAAPQQESAQNAAPQQEAAQSAAPQQEAAQSAASGEWETVKEEGAQGAAYGRYQQPYGQPVYQQAYDPYDHTAEFDARDISDNKVVAMIPYILGIPGLIVAALIGANSPYTMFHVRQELKFTVIETLVGLVAAILCWTIIVPIAAGIFIIVLTIIEIICFFQVCGGKAKEAAIIRSIGFLK